MTLLSNSAVVINRPLRCCCSCCLEQQTARSATRNRDHVWTYLTRDFAHKLKYTLTPHVPSIHWARFQSKSPSTVDCREFGSMPGRENWTMSGMCMSV
ncbi:unnamed protein product [Cercopithifilaria johnstoni]|uniref:Uncharacterized protein n=1 Tax=Cercopithifilaria johnstoni TaxID=2874296 RepID=A0A8J2Q6Z1_9BILA|nr:unnamed protein product [Cercopithifilaria johnstoni]